MIMSTRHFLLYGIILWLSDAVRAPGRHVHFALEVDDQDAVAVEEIPDAKPELPSCDFHLSQSTGRALLPPQWLDGVSGLSKWLTEARSQHDGATTMDLLGLAETSAQRDASLEASLEPGWRAVECSAGLWADGDIIMKQNTHKMHEPHDLYARVLLVWVLSLCGFGLVLVWFCWGVTFTSRRLEVRERVQQWFRAGGNEEQALVQDGSEQREDGSEEQREPSTEPLVSAEVGGSCVYRVGVFFRSH